MTRGVAEIEAHRRLNSSVSLLRTVTEAARERLAWIALLAGGIVSGFVAGLSIAAEHFPIDPGAAIFGCLAVMVLGTTVAVWRKEHTRVE